MPEDVKQVEVHPCDKLNGFCPSMNSRLKMPGNKGGGFFALCIVTKDDMEKKSIELHETIKGVYFQANAKDKGIALNFCPFCGARLDWFRDNGSPIKEEKPKQGSGQ